MATPKRRISHARTHNRKAKFLGALSAAPSTICPRCGEEIQTYRACGSCGYYRGRQVLKIAAEKKEK
ncbi:MAG: 50S ribosomal protein L32 [Synergistaceae bacterium]|jgi:large subunit ribosomal protein L32|nr:50S ribosomal protein L32 [Synergistaceae bacterium]